MTEGANIQLSPEELLSLPEDIRSRIASLAYEHERLAKENILLAEENRLLRAKRFGPSTEKSIYLSGQQMLFNEAEYHFRTSTEEPALEQVQARKKKARGKREADLSGLPTRRIDYELPESERICPACTGPLHEMDEDIRLELEYIPAKACVVEHATHLYACRACDKSAEATPIIRAFSPKPIFSGSLCSASLLSHVASDKYLYHLPLYRQEAAFAHDGITLSRQTLSNWIVRANEDYLFAIMEKMKEKLVKGGVIAADETVIQVLREDGRKAQNKSYMWLYRTGADAKHPLIYYEYQPSRSARCPEKFLEGFNGYLQCDGYKFYRVLKGPIEVVCCWAHVRRKFEEALAILPADKRAESEAYRGLDYINTLFALERTYIKMTDAERASERAKKSVPVAEELYLWASTLGATPKSLLGKAIGYLVNLKPDLMRVFDDGRLELSNNRAERSIKSFVMGRKAWLFSNTPRGADASAAFFSIIETAKENNLNVYEYLKYLFDKLPNMTTSEIDSVVPWSESLPNYVKVPTAYTP
ncbi:MAG: IS66 family transposase [Coriobacteriia bacterium]|nr:IS66 family transposase [Coriobacteriia bacterium]